jgi:hypothetical protein
MADYTTKFAESGKKIRDNYIKQGFPEAYSQYDDATLGELWMKKNNPLQYQMIQQQQQNEQSLQQSQATSAIQSTKELDVNQKKMEQEYQFKQEHPTPLTPTEQAALDDAKQKKESAGKTKANTISLVDELLSRDTGAITGVKNIFKYATGENQYTENLFKELQAKLSLSGREQLKGTGQISDFEAKMLADSVSALKTNLSNEDFAKELAKIKTILSGETTQVNSSNVKPQNGQVKFGENAKDIVNGILNIPSQIANIPQNAVDLQNKYGSMGESIVSGKGPGRDLLMGSSTGMLPEYNKVLGEPLKGGDVVSRIVDRAKEKPITTALDVASLLPFLKIGKGSTKVAPTTEVTGEAGKTAALTDIPNLTKAERVALQTAEKVAGGSKKLGEALPVKWLNKAKENAFDLYKEVIPDTNVIKQAAEDYIARYPSARGIYDKYETSINSIKTVKELDNALKEWSDVFKTNKEIKPGISNDLIAQLWKAGRQELASKAPMVDKVKTIMGETMDISKAAGKALWKTVLAKVLLLH